MKFIDLVKTRQSTRSYNDCAIEDEKLMRCIEAARLAPSATNSQPWRFIIVDEPDLKNTIAETTFSKTLKFNQFVPTAPTLIVIAADKGGIVHKIGQRMTGLPYFLIDIGIAAEHFCLQAAEEGLGTCMIGWFNEKKIKKHLHLKRNERVALLITIGYPTTEKIRDKKRKSIEEVFVRNI